jgi:hypothetical protein
VRRVVEVVDDYDHRDNRDERGGGDNERGR